MAESYRHIDNDQYYALIFLNRKTQKLGMIVNIGTKDRILEYWKYNEEPNGYCILEMVEVKNKQAYKYFQYWDMQKPRQMNTEEQAIKKFDFFKIVYGADLPLEYRGVTNLDQLYSTDHKLKVPKKFEITR